MDWGNPEGVAINNVMVATFSELRRKSAEPQPRVAKAQPWAKIANSFGVITRSPAMSAGLFAFATTVFYGVGLGLGDPCRRGLLLSTKLTQSPWFLNVRGVLKVFHPSFLH